MRGDLGQARERFRFIVEFFDARLLRFFFRL